MIQTYAKLNALPYVDYHSAMADAQKGLPKEFSKDSVHPNLKGYQTMQPLLEKAVQDILTK
jgi:lysophospholipase L1-like esterase